MRGTVALATATNMGADNVHNNIRILHLGGIEVDIILSVTHGSLLVERPFSRFSYSFETWSVKYRDFNFYDENRLNFKWCTS